MKVLIFGGSGMLGHKLGQLLAGQAETYLTFRKAPALYAKYRLFDPERALDNVSAENFESVIRAVARVRPDVVVNCIGIVKQDAAAKDPLTSLTVNSLFPHRLSDLCKAGGARLIHLSTDCIFSGRKGDYRETDTGDAEDLYGRTKLLGEVTGEHCLTLRTSMIGRELAGGHGLLEWFLSQEGKSVRGFKRAIFSGFTTGALSGIIADIIHNHPELNGIRHVAAEPINKFDLLSLIRDTYRLNVEIESDETFICDRSLDGAGFWQQVGGAATPWPLMIEQMYKDSTPYEEIRRIHAY
jgi:dTDP-4-dehydrorhamnose reductase